MVAAVVAADPFVVVDTVASFRFVVVDHCSVVVAAVVAAAFVAVAFVAID